MKAILLASYNNKDNYLLIKDVKTKKEGIQCLICNSQIFEPLHVQKKYCPDCNITLPLANYLSTID